MNDDAPKREAELRALAGRKLGSGKYRDVYEVKGRPDLVLKLEERRGEYQNVMEWRLWLGSHDAWGKASAPWLAPCVELAGLGGGALLMRRTQPMTDEIWANLLVPNFFNDVVPENWGLLDGRPVCHDYGSCSVIMWEPNEAGWQRAASNVWLGQRHLPM